MTSTKAPEETSDELKSVTKEFTHQASIKLAELSNDARVSKNFDETLDKASEYLLEEGSEAKIRRKCAGIDGNERFSREFKTEKPRFVR